MPNDSLRIIHDTVFAKGENAYDLVYKIDYMYQNAWNRLVAVGAVIIAFATIGIPLYLNYVKRKQDQTDKEKTKNFIDQRFAEMKTETQKQFDEKLNNTLTKYNESVEREFSGMKAANFYLIGDSKLNKEEYAFALIQFITSARYSIHARDLGNVKSTLICIINKVIPKMTYKEVRGTEIAYSFKIDDFLKEVAEADKERLLFEEINQFKIALSKIVPPQL